MGTPRWVVDKMLKLVRDQGGDNWSPYWRYLEPACGWGNFLEPILREKLEALKGENEYDWCALKALSTVYGVDIQEDNVLESRARLKRTLFEYASPSEDLVDTILEKNIQVGNTIGDPNQLVFTFWFPEDETHTFFHTETTLAEMGGIDFSKTKRRSVKSADAKASHQA